MNWDSYMWWSIYSYVKCLCFFLHLQCQCNMNTTSKNSISNLAFIVICFLHSFITLSVFVGEWSSPINLSSVQFSRSVMSNSLRPHKRLHTRPPCLSLTPRVHPNPCPLSRWCHPTISSSVVRFSSCLHSFPASRSFPMSNISCY